MTANKAILKLTMRENGRKRRSSLSTAEVIQSPSSNSRAARAERRELHKQLDDARNHIRHLEEQVNVLTNSDEYYTMEERGRRIIQDVWNQVGCSAALVFPTPTSVTCPSVETQHEYASMPGVRGQHAITTGHSSQPILIRGSGYTLIGLVGGSNEESDALKSCNDWTKLPMMKIVGPSYSSGGYARRREAEVTAVLDIDMINRKAELYVPRIGDVAATAEAEVHQTWENLPDRVFVAVAMKRNTEREAVLLPRTHWDVVEVTTTPGGRS